MTLFALPLREPLVMQQMHIEWTFIPPYSPHLGGIWEAGVKSCKYHLKRIMGNTLFTFEKITTALVQIEACLNSRPISPLSSDPADLLPLTPRHFLIGGPLTSLPEIDLSTIKSNRLDQWEAIQQTRFLETVGGRVRGQSSKSGQMEDNKGKHQDR